MPLRVASKNRVLVIGGGVAGLTAALDLSRMGHSVLLIEKGPWVGGHAAGLACKATDRCLKCNDCLVQDLFRAVAQARSFDVRLRTDVARIRSENGGFRGAFRTVSAIIDPERCTGCGDCFQADPDESKRAVLRAPTRYFGPPYAIDRSRWLRLADGDRARVAGLCPEGAIRDADNWEEWEWEGEGVVLATGYEPFRPREKKALTFDRFPNMVTAESVDLMLRESGRITRISDGRPPEKIALVQCVGSRDPSLGHEFCSRVCCGYALRLGLRLVHDDPDAAVTVFYMDIQNFGKAFDRYRREAGARMRLVRGLPGDFYGEEGQRISVSYFHEAEGRTVSEVFDMVVLSVGLMPAAGNPFFRESLGLAQDADGFLALRGPSAEAGLVLAGTAGGPMDVAEAIAGAKAAAWRLGRYLSGASATRTTD